MFGDVLVIGGGVAGITASLELAEKGFKVFLIEKEPSIGGYMAKLDKTFPTLDCSICILGPKMVEAARHPNITLLSYSEVVDVKPLGGEKFMVKVVRKPRYVDETRCTGCRMCVEKCPVKVPNEFEEGLGTRKAIYIPFPQAVPNIALIDKDHCLYFTRGVCRVCEKTCPANAVNFEQEPREVDLEVYSIIVATGFSLLDPSILPQYGYGRYPNVLTSIQYERLMNAAGPTRGEIVRPSDGIHPKRVAMIQCVGSRNTRLKDYCSQICCMYATKQAIVTKEHDPSVDVMIFYNDLNAAGKGHEELTRRAREEYGIRYIKGLPGEVLWDDKAGKLLIRYFELPSGELKTVEADIVVLSPAVLPHPGTVKLAEMLGIELTDQGFFKSNGVISVETNVPGIYVCGACQGPKDISHSVVQALAASSLATKRIMSIKGVAHPSGSEESEIMPTPEVMDGPRGGPRIGVFVCHCGLNIASVVDVKEVVREASKIPDVVYARDLVFACSKDGVEQIKEAIKKHDLNRVVVASCTPSTHERLFRSVCEEAGLNPYLFEMVNIREQVSWVHRKYPREATEKAVELVRMAVAKARLLEPLRRIETRATPSTMVIGGTISGLVAAKTIAETGFKVYLVESRDRLGYDLDLYRSDRKLLDWVENMVESLLANRNVEILLSAKVKEVRGSLGNYHVKIERNNSTLEFETGSIIVALGGESHEPYGRYGYGERGVVHTLQSFRRLQGNLNGRDIAFLLCVGARERTGREYCSAACCEEALRDAIELKERKPDSNVYVVYRDLRLPFDGEKIFREARNRGVKFLRYDGAQPPEITFNGGGLLLTVNDVTLNSTIEIPLDAVVLVTPIVSSGESREVSSLLKVPTNIYGFFIEAHPKLRPVDFSVDGIFLSGLAYGPQRLEDNITQGLAAASRALTISLRGKVVSEPIVAEVNSTHCTGCGTCLDVCEFGAIKLKATPEGGMVAEVDPLLCKGCGSCAVECPSRAIVTHYFRGDQIAAMIKAALEAPPPPDRPKILAFFCNWCGYAAADMAGVSRYEYPPTIEVIRVMCSARVDPIHVIHALLLGADGVLVVGCHPGDCHYISGNLRAKERIDRLREAVKMAGLDPERIRIEWASAGEGLRLSKIIQEMTAKIVEMGFSPLRRCKQA